MPNFDGSGPQGSRVATGRGLGPCGAGIGRRRWFGCGLRRFWGGSQVNPKNEKEMLEEESKILEDELKSVKDRLSELKDQK